MKNNQRLVIHTKDVAAIMGLKEQASRKILRIIRKQYGKSRNQVVTVEEFCAYKGLKTDQVIPLLK